MKNKYLFILLAVLLISCGKENTTPIEESYCSPQETSPTIPPYRGPGWGYKKIDLDNNRFRYPCTNPNNENEFVYFMEDIDKINGGIYTYNYVTNEKRLVLKTDLKTYKNYPQSQIRWSRKGWLIFGAADNNIYKIKPNGDSLIQLTFNNSDFVPEWNLNGTKFITHHYNTKNQYFNLIREENGFVLDSLQYNGIALFQNQTCWNNEQFIFGSNDFGCFLYDYINKTTKFLTSDISIGFPRWINKTEIIYSDFTGNLIYNVTTGKTKQIRKTNNSNGYDYINLLENHKMICQRTNVTLIDPILEVLGYKTTICIINPCDTVVTDFDLR